MANEKLHRIGTALLRTLFAETGRAVWRAVVLALLAGTSVPAIFNGITAHFGFHIPMLTIVSIGVLAFVVFYLIASRTKTTPSLLRRVYKLEELMMHVLPYEPRIYKVIDIHPGDKIFTIEGTKADTYDVIGEPGSRVSLIMGQRFDEYTVDTISNGRGIVRVKVKEPIPAGENYSQLSSSFVPPDPWRVG